MSTLSALGARSLPATAYPVADPQTHARTTNLPASKLAGGDAASAISLSDDGVNLQKRLSTLGNATVDLAQNLIGSFAEALFGDAGKGAAISFDSVSLDAQSSLDVSLQHSSGPDGSSDSAAFQLSDSTHFLGKGSITTADGRKFDFEIEVQYSDQLSASASQTQSGGGSGAANGLARQLGDLAKAVADGGGDGGGAPPATTPVATGSPNLPTVHLPNIDFPGTLADLFRLIGHDLQATLSTNDQSGDKTGGANIDRNTLRNLSLRLLSLVDTKNKDTYAAPNSAEARAKSVANTYGVPAAGTTDGTATAASAAPAVADSDAGQQADRAAAA